MFTLNFLSKIFLHNNDELASEKKEEKHLKEISLVDAVKINGTFFEFALDKYFLK